MSQHSIRFYKYHGTGNDFIIIDDRANILLLDAPEMYAAWCHRHFGIGADGVILLREHPSPDYHFEMVYFNADGKQSSMCGNGGRCIVSFAHQLRLFHRECSFLAIDGPHKGLVDDNGIISIQMQDVRFNTIQKNEYGHLILDTGSPHYVQFREELSSIDVLKEGRQVRYSPAYERHGINVNFVKRKAVNLIEVATYERGVEDETLSCGTGVVASAIAQALTTAPPEQKDHQYYIATKGGDLAVSFSLQDDRFANIWLLGPAKMVFSGNLFL